ncbi:MAG: hypothetical protein K2G30_04455 [Muribaculaceae bacterium]|nr:hypothetical protein [Muribaculaceae bacterium]
MASYPGGIAAITEVTTKATGATNGVGPIGGVTEVTTRVMTGVEDPGYV